MKTHLPQRILILPSGFKESIGAIQVAQCIRNGVKRVLPYCQIQASAIPDGGEDTALILSSVTGGYLVNKMVTGPIGHKVNAHFAMLGGDYSSTAVVEIATAAGLKLVPSNARNPMKTTSYGVGELIIGAIKRGAKEIIVGCGDSGICDGGIGALQALGAQVLDQNGHQVPFGGESLKNIERIDFSNLHPAILNKEVKITLALNMFNVLTGQQGVAKVFGPQKGASSEQVEELSLGLEHWANILTKFSLHDDKAFDFACGSGTGASGGLGAAMAAIGANLASRFEIFMDTNLLGFDLDAALQHCDLVITAEGAIDYQTPRGKIPAEVARRASQYDVPVIALAGTLGAGAEQVYDIGIEAMGSSVPVPMTLSEALSSGESLLTDATERIMRALVLGANIARHKIA